jgi:hypothetical protein
MDRKGPLMDRKGPLKKRLARLLKNHGSYQRMPLGMPKLLNINTPSQDAENKRSAGVSPAVARASCPRKALAASQIFGEDTPSGATVCRIDFFSSLLQRRTKATAELK